MIINFNQSNVGYFTVFNNLNIPNASFCNMKNLVNYCFAGMANKAEGSFNCLKDNVKAIKNTVYLSDTHQAYLKQAVKAGIVAAACFGAYYAYMFSEKNSQVPGMHLIASNANALIKLPEANSLMKFPLAGPIMAYNPDSFNLESLTNLNFSQYTLNNNLSKIAIGRCITCIASVAGLFFYSSFKEITNIDKLEEVSKLLKELTKIIDDLGYDEASLKKQAVHIIGNVSTLLKNVIPHTEPNEQERQIINVIKILDESIKNGCFDKAKKNSDKASILIEIYIEFLKQ